MIPQTFGSNDLSARILVQYVDRPSHTVLLAVAGQFKAGLCDVCAAGEGIAFQEQTGDLT